MSKTLLIILGNQLFNPIYLKKIKFDFIFMAEDYELCSYVKHHKLKILMFLLSMREYCVELRHSNYKVIYKSLEDDSFREKYENKLISVIKTQRIKKLVFFEIEDKFFEARINKFARQNKLTVEILPSPMFLFSREDFKTFADGKNKLLMGKYYQEKRKQLGILLDEEKKPVGGKWSFDEENRKKLPKTIEIPTLLKLKQLDYEEKLKNQIETIFYKHPGSTTNRWMPVSRKDVKHWLKDFLKTKFKDFGPYEDSISSEHNFIFHSALSPMLNNGLLTPSELICELEKYIDKVPINSYEGLVRQVIGWREFIRGIYQEKNDLQETSNFFGHSRKLKQSWYDGTTKIKPLDDAIMFTQTFGYTHHINRLMIIGNIMNLCEIDPREIYKWFMEMFVDSSDWVMTPNVFGMATFADGGLMATKPYICGSNYIVKMSDYKKGPWCDIVDGLYWNFIEKNQKFLQKNPRLSLMVGALNRMDGKKRKHIDERAKEFIKENCR